MTRLLAALGLRVAVWTTIGLTMFGVATFGVAAAQPAADFPKAQPPRRLALVIGEAGYANLPLPGARDDARAVAASLRDLGFERTAPLIDKTREEILREGLAPLLDDIREGDIVVVYFSGHGFNYGGEQYLAPLGAPVGVETANALPGAFISVSALHAALSEARPAWILLALDACRTVTNMVSIGRADQAGRISAAHGGAQERLGDAVIAYATAPGQTAEGSSAAQLSAYTRALASRMKTSQEEMDDVLQRVASDVKIATQQRQRPWIVSNSMADVFLRPGPGVEEAQRATLITAAKDGVRSAVLAFLDRYGAGPYGAAARRWLIENPDAPLFAASGVEPGAVESAWGATQPVTVRRVVAGAAPAPAPVILPEALAPTMRRAPSAAGARRSAIVRGRVVARRAPVETSAPVVLRGERTVALDGVTRDARGREWLRGRTADGASVYLPRDAQQTEEVAIGRPLAEVTLARDARGGLDLAPLRAAIARLREGGSRIVWASIATPPGDGAKAQAGTILDASALRVALLEAGAPRGNVSTLFDDASVSGAARVRVFGR